MTLATTVSAAALDNAPLEDMATDAGAVSVEVDERLAAAGTVPAPAVAVSDDADDNAATPRTVTAPAAVRVEVLDREAAPERATDPEAVSVEVLLRAAVAT